MIILVLNCGSSSLKYQLLDMKSDEVYDLLAKGPASLRICTLLDKPARRRAGITLQPDYTGFVIPNRFVVGYGMDYEEHYRNLPYIGVLKPAVYEK